MNLINPKPLFLGALAWRAEEKELRKLQLKRSKAGKKNKPRAGDEKYN